MYVYGPRPSLPVYNATLAALVDAQREDKAFRVLELMHQSHVQYDQVCGVAGGVCLHVFCHV